MTINLSEAVCFVRCEPIVAAPSMKTAAPDLTPLHYFPFASIPHIATFLPPTLLRIDWYIFFLIIKLC